MGLTRDIEGNPSGFPIWVPRGTRGQSHVGPTWDFPGGFCMGLKRGKITGFNAGYRRESQRVSRLGPSWNPRPIPSGSQAGRPDGPHLGHRAGPVRVPPGCVGWVCSGGVILVAVIIFRCSGYTLASLCFYALHKWLVSYWCRGQR